MWVTPAMEMGPRGAGANAGWDAFSKCPAHYAVSVVACGSPCTGRTSGRGRPGVRPQTSWKKLSQGPSCGTPRRRSPRSQTPRQEGDGGTRDGAVGVACSGQGRCGPMGVLERTSRRPAVRLDEGGRQCRAQKPGRKVQTPPSPRPSALTPGSGLSPAQCCSERPLPDSPTAQLRPHHPSQLAVIPPHTTSCTLCPWEQSWACTVSG